MNLSPINFVLLPMLKKNKHTFGFVGVFHQQCPCTWSLPCLYEQVHFEQNLKEFYNSQIPPSEGRGSTSTNTLSKILPILHLELLDKRRTWVTLYREVQMSRPAPNQMMHLKDEHGEKSWPEDLEHWILAGRCQDRRLKSPFLIKKDDPGVPSIECTINGYSFQKTLYDTGSDINIMAAVTYHLLHGTMPLQPT